MKLWGSAPANILYEADIAEIKRQHEEAARAQQQEEGLKNIPSMDEYRAMAKKKTERQKKEEPPQRKEKQKSKKTKTEGQNDR